MSEAILEAKDIVNRFGEHTVHDGISFSIARGEIVGIVGGSGSGKSVLLKTLLGLHHPNEGTVLLGGTPVQDVAPRDMASMVGVLFQQGALFSSMTVAQNVMMPLLEHTQLSLTERRSIAAMKLAMAGLPADAADKYPAELSGGMVKRASLARALALDPQIVFLDEPTSGLDPASADDFDALVQELNEGLGLTVIMITHDLSTLFGVCDRAAILANKKLIIDTPEALMRRDDPAIQAYFSGARAKGAAQTTQLQGATHAEG